MIQIGLTGWGDHRDLIALGTKNKLPGYSMHFPVVEVESSFYAMQPARNYRKWAGETPPDFGFVIKAYQGMTGHLRGENPFDRPSEMFRVFRETIQPMRESGKLRAVLFQYPPWFACDRTSVDMLRYTKEQMGDIPVALEFRHQSWFAGAMREKTLRFMEQEGWIHSICDEPQAGTGSVPIVLHATHPKMTLVRFHGRNVSGWQGSDGGNWREKRYLYRYSEEELLEWKERLHMLQQSTEQIVIIFNNNSGGDAAGNAKQMMRLLEVEYKGEVPGQMNLFEW